VRRYSWEATYKTDAPPRELSDRESAWNRLVCATWAARWQDVEGYDMKRWTLMHTPASAKASPTAAEGEG
jgi:hypothetical protein